ncbi:hypothetical protein PENTCL1PPCAC_23426, partial [Pristionchus entomophagus]
SANEAWSAVQRTLKSTSQWKRLRLRWGSAGSSTSRTSPLGGSTALSSTVEPSTYGTSWNSVRWNKPVTPGYRSQSSRIAQSFERDKPSSSSYYLSSSSVPRREVSATADKYLNSAAKTAANLASLGPSVSSRASRFDATVADKYRSEARDLISKYTSKERPSSGSGSGGYYSRHFEPQKLSVSQESYTSPRTTSSYTSSTLDRDRENSASRYSVGRDYGSYRKSASVTPTRSPLGRYSETRSITSPGPSSAAGASSTHVLKSERPWRQRMAEGARVRAMHGEDVSASYLASRASRRSSIGRGEADDLTSSISALRNYVAQPAGYRSRTSSIESRIQGRLSRDHSRESIGVPMSASLIAAARKELDEVVDTKAMSRRGVSTQPRDEPIKEEEWREKEKDRRRSARERSEARILSRQSSVGGVGGVGGESSEEEDVGRDKEEARRRRRASRVRRSRTRDQQSMERASSKQDGDAIISIDGAAEEVRSPGPLSPKMGGKLSRSASSKKMVPTKKQSIKSPCLVEVGGPSTTVISTPLPSPVAKDSSAAAAAAPLSLSAANLSYDEISGDTDEAEDESQYNAVTSFKPAFKPKVKPLKPVPGTWKKDDEKEENISKNKTIERPSDRADTSFSWKGPLWMSAKKALRVKPKALIKKEKEAAKEALKEAEKKAKEEAKQKKEEEKRLKEEEKRIKEEEKRVSEIKCSVTLESPKERGSVAIEKTMKHTLRDSVSSSKLREKRPKPASTCLDEVIHSRKKAGAEKCERKWKTKSAPATVSLHCSSSTTSECSLRQSIDRKTKDGEKQAAAKVHVLSGPIDGVTMSRVRLRVRAAIKDERKRQSLPVFPSVLEIDDEDEKTKRNTVILPEEEEEQGLSRSNSERDSRAAIILNEMRVQHPRRTSQDSSSFLVNDPVTGPLVLPDKSILEEYVKRKRGKLEELRGTEGYSSSLDQSNLSDSFYRCDSPTDSTCSDLLPAPEVRIFTHSPRHSALITSSRRSSCSRLSSVEAATPTNMLDTLQPVQQSSPQPAAAFSTPGFLRHGGKVVTLTAKPLPFDTPKTPFEATLQNQANRIRRGEASLVHQDSTASTTSLDEASMQRTGLVSSFNASIAGHARPHERYAAHLPHRSGELSGRTSATSIDSVQSGTLDAASKHVDNMIDQARFKHQAHRSKFKEAIDYLDNIFEDLKKEVDPSAPPTANASPGPSRSVRKTSTTSLNGGEQLQQSQSQQSAVKQALQREAVQKAARNAAAAAGTQGNAALTFVPSTSAPSHPSSSNSLPNRAQRHRQQPQPVTTKEPSPVELSIRPVLKRTPPEDFEVSETVVLPRKTDKLDFTRRWLQDDLSGFTKSPPQMVEGPNTSMYSDPDEHSLGSCSAEVAAINNTKQKRRRDSKPKTDKQPLQQSQSTEKKLAPYRPQPVYGQPTNGTGFPLDVSDSSLTVPGATNSLSRVASYDRLSERLQTRHSDVWRAASQEPYQTLGSVRSEDASSRPSPSAFQNVPTFQRGGLRGSIKSLPDAGLVVKTRNQGHSSSYQTYYPEPPRDPAMAIDALVAELELNTDQNGNATDKRRSFPTALGTAGRQQLQHLQQPQRVVPAASAPAHQAAMQQMQHQRYAPQPVRPVQQPQPQQQYIQLKSVAAPSRPAPVLNGSLGRAKNGHHHLSSGDQSALDEVTHMLQTVSEFPAEKSKKNGEWSSSAPFSAAPSAAPCSRPFDTINQERINPSRVEAIQSMFESRRGSVSVQSIREGFVAGPGYGSNDWRAGGKKNSRDEDAYYDISEYSTSSNPPIIRPPRPSPPPHRAAAAAHPTLAAAVRHSPSGHNQMGAVFQQGAPLGRNGSAGSSQNGGYYSSNSSCAVGPTTSYHQSGSSANRRQSISSRAPSIEDEDDGFYDNIGIYGSMNDDRRFSRGSELGDTVSMSSARLPPSSSKPTRIGSFLSKLGGRSSGSAMMRQPGNAASLVSLNKVAMEPPVQQRGTLTKSSSLSNDPWRKEVIEGSHGKRGSSTGLGARLKNSLFGSKKRLN